MRTLGLTAEKTMDLYYQRYKHKDDFFDVEDFKFYCSVAYAGLLQEEFNKSYAQSRQEEGETGATLSSEWFQEVIVDVEMNRMTGQHEARLCPRPFSFRYDKSNSAIKVIYSAHNSGCTDFVKISAGKEWEVKRYPNTPKVYWFPIADKIVFLNVKCGLKQVRLFYIPSLATMEDSLPIAESFEEDIIRKTLDLMFRAKQGVPFIQMSGDGNPNGMLQTEINPNYKIKTTQTI